MLIIDFLSISYGYDKNNAAVAEEGKGSHMYINISRLKRENWDWQVHGLMNDQIHEFKHMYNRHTGTTPPPTLDENGIPLNEKNATDYQFKIINEMNRSFGTQQYIPRESYKE